MQLWFFNNYLLNEHTFLSYIKLVCCYQVAEDVCTWYRGPSFIQLIDELPSLNRKMDGPFIMPVVDKYKDMGTVLMGKVEAGTTRKTSTLFLMPNRVNYFQY